MVQLRACAALWACDTRRADEWAAHEQRVDGLGGAELLVLKFGDGDFTADDDDVALHESLAGDAALAVHFKAGVEDGVRNGIGNFVRMAFADGFGRKDVGAGHGGGRFGYMDE